MARNISNEAMKRYKRGVVLWLMALVMFILSFGATSTYLAIASLIAAFAMVVTGVIIYASGNRYNNVRSDLTKRTRRANGFAIVFLVITIIMIVLIVSATGSSNPYAGFTAFMFGIWIVPISFALFIGFIAISVSASKRLDALKNNSRYGKSKNSGQQKAST